MLTILYRGPGGEKLFLMFLGRFLAKNLKGCNVHTSLSHNQAKK